MGMKGERDALIVVDRYSKYLDCFPLRSKSAQDAVAAFREFFSSDAPTDVYIWSDSAHELTSAAKSMGFTHGRGTPGRHQATGVCVCVCV